MIEEVINKYEKELDLIEKALKKHQKHLLDKTVLISQKVQVLSFLKDLKKLKSAERD